MWVILFGIISQSVHQILPGGRPLEFHFCTGTNPSSDSDNIKVNYSLIAVFLLSLLMIITIPVKIRFFQLKNQPNHQNEQHHSLTDLTTSISFVFFEGINIAALSVSSIVKNPAAINQFPNNVIAYLCQLILPNLTIFFLVLIYFLRNANLRNCIIRKMKESMYLGRDFDCNNRPIID